MPVRPPPQGHLALKATDVQRLDEQTGASFGTDEKDDSGGFGCQVPHNPACRSLTLQDFQSVFQTALRSVSNRSIVVVGNYENGPITAEACRAKARPLRPRRYYFGPG